MSNGRIPLAIPNLAGNEARYLAQCVETGFVSSVGPFVAQFERLVADASGVPHAVATSSGTSGIHLALCTLGVTRDDLVVLPTFTFIASANAIAHCGATPLLVDVEPEAWTLDVSRLEELLREQCTPQGDRLLHRPTGRRVAAVLPVYTLGNPPRMNEIAEIAARYRLPVVADAAAALGARYRGGPIGPTAAITVYSFNGNKTVTCGGGGMLVGADAATLQRARHLSTTARVGSDYHHDAVGFNYRMTNLQAAVGCAQIEQLETFLEAKRRIRAYYDRELAGPGVEPFPRPAWGESTLWFSGLLLRDSSLPTVPALCELLGSRGIEARPFWKPIHLQPPYRDVPRGSIGIADELWQRIITLPCSTNLEEGALERVAAEVRSALAENRPT